VKEIVEQVHDIIGIRLLQPNPVFGFSKCGDVQNSLVPSQRKRAVILGHYYLAKQDKIRYWKSTACFQCDRAGCNATKNKFIACSSLYVLRESCEEAMRRSKLSLAFQAVSKPSRRMRTGIEIREPRPWLRNTSASLFESNRCRHSNCMNRKGA
jgi:hypothetical protein